MPPEPKTQSDQFAQASHNLDQLRRFSGPPQAFWVGYLEALALLAGARFGVLLHRSGNGQPGWTKVGVWPQKPPVTAGAQSFVRHLDALAGAAAERDTAGQLFDGVPAARGDCGIALRLETDTPQETWVGAFYHEHGADGEATLALRQLKLVANLPGFYQARRAAAEAQASLAQFASVLDLMALLNAQPRYLAVAMTLCNELAARHKCDRVSLGWLVGEYVRLQTISHTERFEKKMEAIRQLEQAMEESLDQDDLVVWPPPEGDTRITRDHNAYADAQRLKFLCSVPLRVGGVTVAVITCERNHEPFLEEEQRLLTLSTEMAVRRLSELKRTDRWFGARWAMGLRENLAKLVGVEHTWLKVTAALVAIGLGMLFFGRMNYRVEAPFILRAEDVAILTTPFDGFIEAVPREVGDVVKAGDPLLKLDTRDLLLEEAGAAADWDRYTREAEKARAANHLAEMRVAQAQVEQAQARLDMIRYRLNQAEIKAPFAGVVVEGDLRKRLGAPVKQGDALFRVARTDRLYVECDVNERDIHEVRGDATGEIAFASRPKLKFPVTLERIEPAAQSKEKDNVFLVRCEFEQPVEAWWRPGMSGVAKINVGKRTFFWVVSHRTVDFLRMFFWM